jgi:hypothetical protein
LELGASTQGWYRNQDGLNIRFFSDPSEGAVFPTFVGSYFDPRCFEEIGQVPPNCGLPFEFNSYFVFDLGGLTAPIESATLRLPVKQFISTSTSETITLRALERTSTSQLLSTIGSIDIYDDLGDGAIIGQQTITVPEPPETASDTIITRIIDIELTDTDLINDAIEESKILSFGATLETAGDSPFEFFPGPESTEGLLFSDGDRDYSDPNSPDIYTDAEILALRDAEAPAILVLKEKPPAEPKAVPEPTSALSISLIGFVLAYYRRRRSPQQRATETRPCREIS